jgi:predicted DNA-binding antitoxin AbrB/MazE fold protein
MAITVEAVYEDGVLKPSQPLPLGDKERVRITLHGEADVQQAPPVVESRGARLIREARQGHADFVAGWRTFIQELGIQGNPIGAKQLRELLLKSGINPDDNEFSREIIAMREE